MIPKTVITVLKISDMVGIPNISANRVLNGGPKNIPIEYADWNIPRDIALLSLFDLEIENPRKRGRLIPYDIPMAICAIIKLMKLSEYPVIIIPADKIIKANIPINRLFLLFTTLFSKIFTIIEIRIHGRFKTTATSTLLHLGYL